VIHENIAFYPIARSISRETFVLREFQGGGSLLIVSMPT
jgi:hypothetical protein